MNLFPEVFRDITLGPEAAAFLRECLADGKTLSHCLLERRDLGMGSIFTFLPRDANLDSITDFMVGGKLPQPPTETHARVTFSDGSAGGTLVPIPNTNPELAARIQTFLRGGADRLCIFQDPMSESADSWIASATTKLLVLGPEVYHVLDTSDDDRDQILDTIQEASTSIYPPLVGILTHGPSQPRRICRTSSEEIRQLAEMAESIIVAAYNGEGYIVWNRSRAQLMQGC